MPHHWQLATLFGVAHRHKCRCPSSCIYAACLRILCCEPPLLLLLFASPFSSLRIYLFAKCSMALIDVPRRQQLKRQRQRHRLVRGVKLAGILGLRQVQINNDNRHQTADNSHQDNNNQQVLHFVQTKRPPNRRPNPNSEPPQSEAQSKHQIDLSIRWKTAKVAHTFRWHLKVI